MSQVYYYYYYFLFFSTFYKSNAHIQNEINQTIKRVYNKLRIYKAIKKTQWNLFFCRLDDYYSIYIQKIYTDQCRENEEITMIINYIWRCVLSVDRQVFFFSLFFIRFLYCIINVCMRISLYQDIWYTTIYLIPPPYVCSFYFIFSSRNNNNINRLVMLCQKDPTAILSFEQVISNGPTFKSLYFVGSIVYLTLYVY